MASLRNRGSIKGSISETLLRGEKGYSAYEIAVQNGFEGTEEEWLESLKGEKGDPGNDGQDGKEPTSIYISADGCLHIHFNDGSSFVSQSIKGDPGEPAVNPVRGVDYWTAADQAAVIEAACQAAIEQYPVAEEVGF